MKQQEWFEESYRRISQSETGQVRPRGDFLRSFAIVEEQGRASLDETIFDHLSPARRFVVCDIIWCVGPDEGGWGGLRNVHVLLARAQRQANSGNGIYAAQLFVEVGQMLRESEWFERIGYPRGENDVAMIATGEWA